MKATYATATILALASARTATTVHSLRVVDSVDGDAAVPLQAILQTDAHEWRAPVVDKTLPSESAGWATPQKPVFAGRVVRRESQTADGAVSTTTSTKTHNDKKKKKTKTNANDKPNAKKTTGAKSKPDNKKTNSDKKAKTKEKEKEKEKKKRNGEHPVERTDSKPQSKTSSPSHAAGGKTRREGRPRGTVAAADEDLYAAALGGMLSHQFYNGAQIEEEARTVGAAVVTHMAESFRDETSKSLVFSGTIAGLAVSVLGTVAAVVALFRQRSEFAEVEFESDLPDLESGREASAAATADATSREDGSDGDAEQQDAAAAPAVTVVVASESALDVD